MNSASRILLMYFHPLKKKIRRKSLIHSVTKNVRTQQEMSYNHETPRVCSVWRDKQMIRNSEQKIVLLRSYHMKNVVNQ